LVETLIMRAVMSSVTVARLLERLDVEDQQACASLLRKVESLARMACRCEARDLPASEVEELVQDTLLVVWQRRSTFDPDKGRFESWVRGICRHVCRAARRRKRDVLTEDGVLEVASLERSVLRLLREKERKLVLTEAIESLVGQDRDVLYHRYIHSLSRREIAELMGVETDVVRVRLQTASRHLRKELERRLELLGQSFFRSVSEQSSGPS
jgi:RNA polymerase sigma-70 factor (ECF subfamily)